ncbi:MAG TPA: diguanylate cyclase [Solirubrobacteraceae bacterium]|nr:diguanylate cyclase [Solirubrobacteraceae bacterium]
MPRTGSLTRAQASPSLRELPDSHTAQVSHGGLGTGLSWVSPAEQLSAEPGQVPTTPSAWCTAFFFCLYALIVGAAIVLESNWHNPLLIALIVALTVWSRSHSVKVTSSDSAKDAHAFSLNGVCILALAALNGPLPAVVAAFASEIAPFISARFHYAERRSTVSDLACNLASAGAFALIAGVTLTAAGSEFGHGAAFFITVFVVSLVADFVSLLLVAAHNYLGYRQSSMHTLVPYLTTWRTLFPALALSTAVLVIALWVNETSGPAAFSFAVLSLVGIQSLLARTSRVEYALRQERDKVAWLAHHDGLTGLWNRLAFDAQLTAATAAPAQERFALLFLDLDGFKQVNDTMGHVAGDELLRAVADRLIGSLREHDRVFRQGGDEFLIVARTETDEDLGLIVQRVEGIFANPFSVAGATLGVSGSLGVAEWPNDAATGKALLHVADSRMYEHKDHGARRNPPTAATAR